MITYVVGDIFASPAQVLVNTVNTVGVMGKGLAHTFKRVYPDMFEEYRRRCERGTLNIGDLYLYKSRHKWVLNFPTKKHWRAKSRIEYIEAGLKEFADTYERMSIKSISFPMLGCQHGGLDWEDVKPVMERYLGDLPTGVEVKVHLFRPGLLTFPDYRNVAGLTKRLRGELDFVGFSGFWKGLEFGRIAGFCLRRSTVEQIWAQMKDGRYLSITEFFALIQHESDTHINFTDMPKLQRPAGYVFVVAEKGAYRIGRTSDPAKYPGAANLGTVVTVFESADVRETVRSLRSTYAANRIAVRNQLFGLDASQLHEIRVNAARQGNARMPFSLVEFFENLPFVQRVYMSWGTEPTVRDRAFQLIPTKVKAPGKQKGMLL